MHAAHGSHEGGGLQAAHGSHGTGGLHAAHGFQGEGGMHMAHGFHERGGPQTAQGGDMAEPGRQGPPFAVAVAKGTLHCGAGCTLGDILAETLALLAPGVLALFGYPGLFATRIYAVWGLDFVFAFVLGIIFQYFAIAPMRGLGPAAGLKAALKADAASLVSWQVGMYGFMAIAHFALFPALTGGGVDAATPEFWFAMQIAMLAGFATAFPVNWWLIRSGVKERM
ncbi:DUF4396 domain-containing protein [Paroceanicella profunda]|uniref:DUF4396 domain-containing protein n=2 Tax=Paroceanicella profunda TaxID=2579971 RepID=A0A5B8G2P0_9RHOB|nr:DUF4396 domain-containing protein [Paroceanicella profunda]